MKVTVDLLTDPSQEAPSVHSQHLFAHDKQLRRDGRPFSSLFDSFVAACLHKRPPSRPTAESLLLHPWLASAGPEDRVAAGRTELVALLANETLFDSVNEEGKESESSSPSWSVSPDLSNMNFEDENYGKEDESRQLSLPAVPSVPGEGPGPLPAALTSEGSERLSHSPAPRSVHFCSSMAVLDGQTQSVTALKDSTNDKSFGKTQRARNTLGSDPDSDFDFDGSDTNPNPTPILSPVARNASPQKFVPGTTWVFDSGGTGSGSGTGTGTEGGSAAGQAEEDLEEFLQDFESEQATIREEKDSINKAISSEGASGHVDSPPGGGVSDRVRNEYRGLNDAIEIGDAGEAGRTDDGLSVAVKSSTEDFLDEFEQEVIRDES